MASDDLLKKAMSFKVPALGRRGQFTDVELLPLAVAWARGEISFTAVTKAVGDGRPVGGSSYSYLARGLRAYVVRLDAEAAARKEQGRG